MDAKLDLTKAINTVKQSKAVTIKQSTLQEMKTPSNVDGVQFKAKPTVFWQF